jgi:hypothetical protein
VPEAPQMMAMSQILGMVRMALWALPLVGLIQLVLPAISRFRGHAGFLGLVARFLFGTLFLWVAFIPLAGVPEAHQPYIGPAIWALLFGALLMMAASLFGVTRSNGWAVLLADAAILFGTGYALVWFGEMIQRA